MGKTGSTAIARAVQDATGRRVFQVFRLEPDRLAQAEGRYRAGAAAAVPGRDAPLGVGVPPAPPAERGRAVDGDHDRARTDRPSGVGVLPRQRPARAARATTRPPARSPRRCSRAAGSARRCAGSIASSRPRSASTCSRTPFDPELGHVVIETPTARVLLLRQENLGGRARRARPGSSGARRRCRCPARNEATTKEYAAATASSSPRSGCRPTVLDQAYGSRYARHFYADSELERFRQRWTKGSEAV